MSIVDELEKLEKDARFGKDKHFSAADRHRAYHYRLGLPVIAIGVFLGSVVFTDIVFYGLEYQKVVTPILAFISALLAALQTFLNPKEMEKGNRSIANRYLEISRNCRLVSAKINDDLISIEDATKIYEEILSSYNETNIEAEAFPISKKDFQLANIKIT